MAKAVVLEQGARDELLSNPESTYSRLVAAQKLREANERRDDDDDELGASLRRMRKKRRAVRWSVRPLLRSLLGAVGHGHVLCSDTLSTPSSLFV